MNQQFFSPAGDITPDAAPFRSDSGCSGDFLDLLSTHFLICNEKLQGLGEDCGLESYNSECGLMGAFDGCGGLGSKVCPSLSDKTEAYLASRAVGAAALKWFHTNTAAKGQWNLDGLRNLMCTHLDLCQKQSGDEGLRLRGTLVRPFPSTVAMITCHLTDGQLVTRHIWAGDSRTYVLDAQGLGQISVDDIKGEDAMSNLTRDGALTNVVSSDGRFTLHSAGFNPAGPCILFCATDGCFGYVRSPMEFELMILATLLQSENVDQWRKRLSQQIRSRAGDDQTLALAAFGYDNFEQLRRAFLSRFQKVSLIVNRFNSADPAQQQQLWEDYKPNYYRYHASKE